MKTRILLIVTSDPRRSGRPAEAIRIAAGLGGWGKVEAGVYLRGPATLALGESAEDLEDGDNFVRYLPLIAGATGEILVQRGAGELATLGLAGIRYREISDDELAALAATCAYTLHF